MVLIINSTLKDKAINIINDQGYEAYHIGVIQNKNITNTINYI